MPGSLLSVSAQGVTLPWLKARVGFLGQRISGCASKHQGPEHISAKLEAGRLAHLGALKRCASEGQTRRRKKLEVDVKDFERGHV